MLPGWPVTIADPAAPAAGTLTYSRHAVSSPARLGDLVVFETRFEYDLTPPTFDVPATHLLRELIVAVDPRSAAVDWQQEIGNRVVPTTNDIPELNLSPTPVSFATDSSPLVAVASSIVPVVQVYDVGGKQVWNASLSAPTRSSPVFANGLLIVATDMGVGARSSSDANHAPAAPTDGFSPADGEMVSDPAPTLKWAAAQDPEGQALRYQVRVLGDGGDLYESPLAQLDAKAGETQVALASMQLEPGATYRYAVRSRDESGAWSSWSPLHTFLMAIPATIKVGDKSFDSVDAAIASLPATGGQIVLGRGALSLKAPLQLPAGVSLVGVSPPDPIIDATGGKVSVEMSVANRAGAALKNLTVMGADVGVDVVDVQDAILRNVVVRDNQKVGVQIEEPAAAEAVNVTLARNGTGASVDGKLSIHASIVIQNATGLARRSGLRDEPLQATSSATRRRTAGRLGGHGRSLRGRDLPLEHRLHLVGFQQTTDKVIPATSTGSSRSQVARVNLGAFGNTATAELSQSVSWTRSPTSATGVAGAAAGADLHRSCVERAPSRRKANSACRRRRQQPRSPTRRPSRRSGCCSPSARSCSPAAAAARATPRRAGGARRRSSLARASSPLTRCRGSPPRRG